MKTNNLRFEFEQTGYVILPKLVSNVESIKSDVPKERGVLRYYKNDFIHEPGEIQVPGCISRYNIPMYKDLHYQIKNFLEKKFDINLYPTYYFDRFYFAGQELVKHIDRPACEISVTLQISTNGKEPWHIWFETSTGEEKCAIMDDGDGVVYMGCERPHWRYPLKSRYTRPQKLWRKFKKLPDDTYHHQIFLHYVNADGYNLHHAFDACN